MICHAFLTWEPDIALCRKSRVAGVARALGCSQQELPKGILVRHLQHCLGQGLQLPKHSASSGPGAGRGKGEGGQWPWLQKEWLRPDTRRKFLGFQGQ